MANLIPVGRGSWNIFLVNGIAVYTLISIGQYDAMRNAAAQDGVSLGWLHSYTDSEEDAQKYCTDYNNTTEEIKAISLKELLNTLFE